MSSRNLTVLPSPPPHGPDEYATSDEARAAIMQLTGAELAKLRFVAELHCRHYGIPEKHMEPEELLQEAFCRTLNLTKQWRKGVKLLYHLDRAMENIAGHEVPKLMRRVELRVVDEGENADEGDPLDDFQKPRSSNETVVAVVYAREELQQLEEIFNDDKPAFDVLVARARGQEGKEIQKTLKLTKKDYEAISKRIQRKTKSYYEPDPRQSRPGEELNFHRAFCELVLETSDAEFEEIVRSFGHNSTDLEHQAREAWTAALSETPTNVVHLSESQSLPAPSDVQRGFSSLMRLLRRRKEMEIPELALSAQVDPIELSSIEEQPGYLPHPRTIYQLEHFFGLPKDTLSRLSGAVVKNSDSIQSELLKFAACSDGMGKLTSDEKKLLNEFVKHIAKRK